MAWIRTFALLRISNSSGAAASAVAEAFCAQFGVAMWEVLQVKSLSQLTNYSFQFEKFNCSGRIYFNFKITEVNV